MMTRAPAALVDEGRPRRVSERHQPKLNTADVPAVDYRELVIVDLAGEVAQLTELRAEVRVTREMLAIAIGMLGDSERRTAARDRCIAALIEELRRYTAAAAGQ